MTEENISTSTSEETTEVTEAAEQKTKRSRSKAAPAVDTTVVTPVLEDNTAPTASSHSIQAAIQEKLSSRGEGDNPFVPQTQLTEEMKEAAQTAGFALNRGTEIGARLMARANRNIGR